MPRIEAADAPQDTLFQPTAAWVFRSAPRIIAFGFGAGLLRPAPGTWGTALGWLLWAVALSHCPEAVIAVGLVVAFALGCWCCHRTGRDMGRADYGGMVWDEMVAIWLVLWLAPGSLVFQCIGFVAFRAFDIIKPPPIHFFDSHLKNGFGVMWDDIVAAVYTLLVIAVLVRLEVLL
jgi:phosphatidylglycerophosphatase A